MTTATNVNRLVNRHMARLLTDLSDAGCPVIYIEAVKSEMSWLRSDLQDELGAKDDKGNKEVYGLSPRIVSR